MFRAEDVMPVTVSTPMRWRWLTRGSWGGEGGPPAHPGMIETGLVAESPPASEDPPRILYEQDEAVRDGVVQSWFAGPYHSPQSGADDASRDLLCCLTERS
jgi:hypothetical protein